MAGNLRFQLCLVLCALTVSVFCGCSRFVPAALPGDPAAVAHGEEQAINDGEIATLESKDGQVVVCAGDEVRLFLTDGEMIEGNVIRVSDSELVTGKIGNYGLEEQVTDAEVIDFIEVRKMTKGGSIAANTTLIFAAVFVVLAIALSGVQWGAT